MALTPSYQIPVKRVVMERWQMKGGQVERWMNDTLGRRLCGSIGLELVGLRKEIIIQDISIVRLLLDGGLILLLIFATVIVIFVRMEIPYSVLLRTAQNDILSEPYSKREIFAALMQLNPSKATGLDGFPVDFFHDGFNDTLIVLIPKMKKQIELMEELRPISLTKVISRVVAKAMVNSLQSFLPERCWIEFGAKRMDGVLVDCLLTVRKY
ncbi:hypothetical protein QQ045_002674 [Rhodiola kirilowii]